MTVLITDQNGGIYPNNSTDDKVNLGFFMALCSFVINAKKVAGSTDNTQKAFLKIFGLAKKNQRDGVKPDILVVWFKNMLVKASITDPSKIAYPAPKRRILDEATVTKQKDKIKAQQGDEAVKKREDDNEKVNSKKGKCFVKLNIFRGHGICFLTSGGAAKFYDETNGSYFMSKKVCVAIIPDCIDIFTAMAKVNIIISSLLKIRIAVSNKPAEPTSVDPMPEDTTVTKLEECQKDSTACQTNEDLLKIVCAEIAFTGENPTTEGNLQNSTDSQLEADTQDSARRLRLVRILASRPTIQRRVLDDTEVDASGYATLDASGVDLAADFASGDADDENESEALGSGIFNIAALFLVGLLIR